MYLKFRKKLISELNKVKNIIPDIDDEIDDIIQSFEILGKEEMEDGSFEDEFNYRWDDLYNFADAYKIWVKIR